jgi:hypothetical protein
VEDHQEQLLLSADPDTRVGHKSADSSFFGYKTHIAMNDERIITVATVTTGEKSDGKYLQELIEKSLETGMKLIRFWVMLRIQRKTIFSMRKKMNYS